MGFKLHSASAPAVLCCLLGLTFAPLFSGTSLANVATLSAFANSVSTAAASDPVLSEAYGARSYTPIWTDPASATRLSALFDALSNADFHGLAVNRYDPASLVRAVSEARTEGDLGRLEVRLTQTFLAYATDLTSGITTPSTIDPGMLRMVDKPEPAVLIAGLLGSKNPAEYLRSLAPKTPVYARLIREKIYLEQRIANVNATNTLTYVELPFGSEGPTVIALRDRLIDLGYLAQTAVASYDLSLRRSVQRFQIERGLTSDGMATEATIDALNTTDHQRLKSVIVALERLRWLGEPDLSGRYVWVNLPDFTAKIFDGGKLVFQTRSVIGKAEPETRTPEFSDEMEYMVVNPSWGVPRSITVKEYLPLLQRNANAVSQLDVVDRSGRIIPRSAVNFASYSEKSFPFGLRQKPSESNALGLVKFLFPNTNNIYLHDTPSKNLFSKDVRAYSHGCIRLGNPFDFAYALLAVQSLNPQAEFAKVLGSGRETSINLDQHVPVHLVYFTAWPNAKGEIEYRNDIYGRDGLILDALVAAGVVLPGISR